jgi:hypothetical protein
MKVIKPKSVHVPTPWSKEAECRICSAKLLVEESDLQRESGSNSITGTRWDYCFFECIECGSFQGIPDVPDDVLITVVPNYKKERKFKKK